MRKKQLYAYGLYGRCPVCHDIKQVKCKYCGETEFFTDSSKPGHVLCTKCNTHNKLLCENNICNSQPLTLRTPKTDEERDRIVQYIAKLKDNKLNKRNYTVITTPPTKTVVKIEEVLIRADIQKADAQNVNDLDNTDRINEPNRRKVEDRRVENKGKNYKNVNTERRIVNQFYDEKNDGTLDKKINFENNYDESVFYDCHICGKEEIKIVCDKCGRDNHFSLNYDALSCECGNEIRVKICSCGAKHGHTNFYLMSKDSIKWQYSTKKSYYNYRKGRMLVFSTCPSCDSFTVEKCSSCGSKVNFGKPNQNNEVYCKNCGTVNQFTCNNLGCNNSVKILQNPNSIENKLELLNRAISVVDIDNKKKQRAKKEKLGTKTNTKITTKAKTKITHESYIEDPSIKKDLLTKSMITSSSFIGEIEERVNEREQINNDLKMHNLKYVEYTYYSTTKKRTSLFYLLIILLIIITITAGVIGYLYYMNGSFDFLKI